jgi:hypothetical protein
MKKAIIFGFVGTLVFTFLACSRGHALYKPGPIAVPAQVNSKKVDQIVKQKLDQRGWYIEKAQPGKVIARIQRGEAMAKIQVKYDKNNVTISYLDSQNFHYRKEGDNEFIHGRYNSWILNIERDINNELSLLR